MEKFNYNLDELTEEEELASERREATRIADMREAGGLIVRISNELWKEIIEESR
jgi:hypothetical protein